MDTSNSGFQLFLGMDQYELVDRSDLSSLSQSSDSYASGYTDLKFNTYANVTSPRMMDAYPQSPCIMSLLESSKQLTKSRATLITSFQEVISSCDTQLCDDDIVDLYFQCGGRVFVDSLLDEIARPRATAEHKRAAVDSLIWVCSRSACQPSAKVAQIVRELLELSSSSANYSREVAEDAIWQLMSQPTTYPHVLESLKDPHVVLAMLDARLKNPATPAFVLLHAIDAIQQFRKHPSTGVDELDHIDQTLTKAMVELLLSEQTDSEVATACLHSIKQWLEAGDAASVAFVQARGVEALRRLLLTGGTKQQLAALVCLVTAAEKSPQGTQEVITAAFKDNSICAPITRLMSEDRSSLFPAMWLLCTAAEALPHVLLSLQSPPTLLPLLVDLTPDVTSHPRLQTLTLRLLTLLTAPSSAPLKEPALLQQLVHMVMLLLLPFSSSTNNMEPATPTCCASDTAPASCARENAQGEGRHSAASPSGDHSVAQSPSCVVPGVSSGGAVHACDGASVQAGNQSTIDLSEQRLSDGSDCNASCSTGTHHGNAAQTAGDGGCADTDWPLLGVCVNLFENLSTRSEEDPAARQLLCTVVLDFLKLHPLPEQPEDGELDSCTKLLLDVVLILCTNANFGQRMLLNGLASQWVAFARSQPGAQRLRLGVVEMADQIMRSCKEGSPASIRGKEDASSSGRQAEADVIGSCEEAASVFHSCGLLDVVLSVLKGSVLADGDSADLELNLAENDGAMQALRALESLFACPTAAKEACHAAVAPGLSVVTLLMDKLLRQAWSAHLCMDILKIWVATGDIAVASAVIQNKRAMKAIMAQAAKGDEVHSAVCAGCVDVLQRMCSMFPLEMADGRVLEECVPKLLGSSSVCQQLAGIGIVSALVEAPIEEVLLECQRHALPPLVRRLFEGCDRSAEAAAPLVVALMADSWSLTALDARGWRAADHLTQLSSSCLTEARGEAGRQVVAARLMVMTEAVLLDEACRAAAAANTSAVQVLLSLISPHPPAGLHLDQRKVFQALTHIAAHHIDAVAEAILATNAMDSIIATVSVDDAPPEVPPPGDSGKLCAAGGSSRQGIKEGDENLQHDGCEVEMRQRRDDHREAALQLMAVLVRDNSMKRLMYVRRVAEVLVRVIQGADAGCQQQVGEQPEGSDDTESSLVHEAKQVLAGLGLEYLIQS